MLEVYPVPDDQANAQTRAMRRVLEERYRDIQAGPEADAAGKARRAAERASKAPERKARWTGGGGGEEAKTRACRIVTT